MRKQIEMTGIPPKDQAVDIAKKKKRQWENGFQKWSNEQAQDSYTSLGKCGYGSMCDYCTANYFGRPCVRALNTMCREERISIDYEKQTYEEVWNL